MIMLDFDQLTYRDLQKFAALFNIKANQKRTVILALLRSIPEAVDALIKFEAIPGPRYIKSFNSNKSNVVKKAGRKRLHAYEQSNKKMIKFSKEFQDCWEIMKNFSDTFWYHLTNELQSVYHYEVNTDSFQPTPKDQFILINLPVLTATDVEEFFYTVDYLYPTEIHYLP